MIWIVLAISFTVGWIIIYTEIGSRKLHKRIYERESLIHNYKLKEITAKSK